MTALYNLGEAMSSRSWERKAEEYLRKEYPASEGWEINPRFDLGGHRPDFVLIKNPSRVLLRKEKPEEIAYVEVKDVPVLKCEHVDQLLKYMRQCRFEVDYGLILVSTSTRVPNGVHAYAMCAHDHPIEVLKLHEGPSGITASDEIGTDIEASEIPTPEDIGNPSEIPYVEGFYEE